MSKRLLPFPGKAVGVNEVILKNYELSIYGDIHDVTNLIFFNVLKIATPKPTL
jgi:hypothetical protein